jgi:hypothetical protein
VSNLEVDQKICTDEMQYLPKAGSLHITLTPTISHFLETYRVASPETPRSSRQEVRFKGELLQVFTSGGVEERDQSLQ